MLPRSPSPALLTHRAIGPFVSTAGSDTNNCGPTTPCRTFAAALALTNSGGELVVLTSGGYGDVMIARPVTITAIGVDASITETSGNAVTINTTGNVTIDGLGLHGEGTGQNGVLVIQVGFLRLYNVTAENFAQDGVYFVGAGNIAIYGSRFNDNTNQGLEVAGGNVYVQNTEFEHNGSAGVFQYGAASVILADSHVHYNELGIFAYGGTLSLIRDEAVLNEIGLAADNGAAVQISYCLIAQNTSYAYRISGAATFSGTSPGTNTIIGATGGLLSPTTLR